MTHLINEPENGLQTIGPFLSEIEASDAREWIGDLGAQMSDPVKIDIDTWILVGA